MITLLNYHIGNISLVYIGIFSSMAKRERYIQCSRYDQRISGRAVFLRQLKKKNLDSSF